MVATRKFDPETSRIPTPTALACLTAAALRKWPGTGFDRSGPSAPGPTYPGRSRREPMTPLQSARPNDSPPGPSGHPLPEAMGLGSACARSVGTFVSQFTSFLALNRGATAHNGRGPCRNDEGSQHPMLGAIRAIPLVPPGSASPMGTVYRSEHG